MAEKTEEEPKASKGDAGAKESPSADTDEEETREDKEELEDPDEAHVAPPVAALGRLSDVVYYAIGAILLVLGGAVAVQIVTEFFTSDDSFTHRVTQVVYGVLFVVIVLELLRTVLAHFQDDTFHLKPFIIIGIVSVVRHILTVGAEISLEEEPGGDLFRRSDIELAINAAVVLVLVIGLGLIRETE